MWSTEAYVVYMQSLLLREKKGTTFLNELQIQPITGGQAGRQSSCKQAPVFSSNAKGSSIRGSRLSSERHALPTMTSFPLPDMYQGGFCLAASEATRILITRAPSGFLAGACKYQKGIICCECRHTPGRRAPVSDFGEQDITWAPIIYTGVQSNDYLGPESFWKAYRTIFNTTWAESKTVRHETRWVCLWYWCYFKWPAGGFRGQLMGKMGAGD